MTEKAKTNSTKETGNKLPAAPENRQTQLARISHYLNSDAVKSRLMEVAGHDAKHYIASAMLAVAADDSGNLLRCTPSSIYLSILRAATLRLSVDPALGQAYIVPYGKEYPKATLIPGYKGLQDMAVRTGRYRFINTAPIYEGEGIDIDRISGKAALVGSKTGAEIVGWVASFEMLSGFSKTIYMTIEEIQDHAAQYSPGYASNHPKNIWKTNLPEMQRKTVLRRLLRKWGYMDPADIRQIEELEMETPVFDAKFIDEEMAKTEKKSEALIMHELGFGPKPPEAPEEAELPEEIEPEDLDQ